MLAPDTVLQGRYRIVRPIGEGGMGAVYMATDQRLRSTVALKETLFSDEKLRKAFEHEAELLASLHHPALPNVSDHFIEADGQFLVMQFIPGDDLSEMLKRNGGPFSPDEVLEWADQLLDALDYLHTQDPPIIHRDIKPQNLKLTSRGHIVLLDFGLAKGTPLQISRVTTSGSIFGYTPNYAPLEQIHGTGTDQRSDLYSLAATLYHLMTGVIPPDALSRATALVSEQPDPLRPANELNARIPPAVAGVLHRVMSQNKVQRYASAAEFRNSLRNARNGILTTTESEARTVLMPQPAATTGGAAHVSQPPATDIAQPEHETRILNHGATTPMAAAGTAVPPPVVDQETDLPTRVQKASTAGRNRLTAWYVAGSLGVLLLACLGIYGWKQRASHWSQPAAVETSAPAMIPQGPSPASSPDAEPPATAMEEAPAQDEPTGNGAPPATTTGKSAQSQAAQQKKKKAEVAEENDTSDETDPGMSEETKREVQQALREADAAQRNAERLRQAGERWKDFNRSRDYHYPQPPGAPGNGNPVPNPANNGRKGKAQIFTHPNADGSITTTMVRPNGQILTFTKNPDGTMRGKPVLTPAP